MLFPSVLQQKVTGKPPWVCSRAEREAVSTYIAILHSDTPNEQVTTEVMRPYCGGTRLALAQVLTDISYGFSLFSRNTPFCHVPTPPYSQSTIIWRLIQRHAT
jgi:hypothetical protein